MTFTRPKEELVREIRTRAFAATYNSMGNLANQPMNNITYVIQAAIADAVAAGFEAMIENTYTDAQFEEDMKLRT